MSYDMLRHFADSYGLLFMTLTFLGLVAWTLRSSARQDHARAAASIFDDDAGIAGDEARIAGDEARIAGDEEPPHG